MQTWCETHKLISGLWLLAACGNSAVASLWQNRRHQSREHSSSRHEMSAKGTPSVLRQRCGFTGAAGCEGSGQRVAVAGGMRRPGWRSGNATASLDRSLASASGIAHPGRVMHPRDRHHDSRCFTSRGPVNPPARARRTLGVPFATHLVREL